MYNCSFDSYSCKVVLNFITLPRGLTLGPDSSSGRASASGSGGRRFDPRPRHTKGVKNGTGSSLANACNKGSSRKIQEGR